MDGHEWPYFVKNNMYGYELDPHLKANMLFSDEPGFISRASSASGLKTICLSPNRDRNC